MDILTHNREAWAKEVAEGNKWSRPVAPETIAAARRGVWSLVLTPTLPVPRDWFGEVAGKEILCLASAGGQQAPVLAAAGARVTVFDNSPAMLGQDELVAKRENLSLSLVQGDMRDLSRLRDQSFDLIFHPVSNCFVDDIDPVWKGCARVLRKGGRLLAGFCNPLLYIFDMKAWDDEGALKVRYHIPYSDLEQLPPEQLAERLRKKETIDFGHSLEAQIGGQIGAGFLIAGFLEDDWGGAFLDPYIKTFIATLAIRS